MRRVSSAMPNDDMQYHLRQREFRMNELQDKMASQQRIKNLRDDPLGAGRAVRFDSGVRRMNRFDRNIEIVRGNLAVTEGYTREAIDILQRANEIAVQGANGIYSREQTAAMAEEVDQLLKELVQLGNARSEEGNTIFGGTQTNTDAFRTRLGPVAGSGVERIVAVDYTGNVGVNTAEVDQGSFVPTAIPGNVAFWAENQQVYAAVDATTYRVQQDTSIRIDGVGIKLAAGDNVAAIIAKINDSAAPVRASLDPVQNSLVIASTKPHQIWLEDLEGGTALQDLGLLRGGTAGAPGTNLAPSARAFGGSVFDMVMHLRDRLFAGDSAEVGGSALQGIHQAIESLTATLADIGSRDERLALVSGRLDYEIPEVTKLLSQETDLDLSRAITDLKMLDYTHQAALGTAARILRPTLLDFLR
jgi:flagellar hook-associated protein 3 FlgL